MVRNIVYCEIVGYISLSKTLNLLTIKCYKGILLKVAQIFRIAFEIGFVLLGIKIIGKVLIEGLKILWVVFPLFDLLFDEIVEIGRGYLRDLPV